MVDDLSDYIFCPICREKFDVADPNSLKRPVACNACRDHMCVGCVDRAGRADCPKCFQDGFSYEDPRPEIMFWLWLKETRESDIHKFSNPQSGSIEQQTITPAEERETVVAVDGHASARGQAVIPGECSGQQPNTGPTNMEASQTQNRSNEPEEQNLHAHPRRTKKLTPRPDDNNISTSRDVSSARPPPPGHSTVEVTVQEGRLGIGLASELVVSHVASSPSLSGKIFTGDQSQSTNQQRVLRVHRPGGNSSTSSDNQNDNAGSLSASGASTNERLCASKLVADEDDGRSDRQEGPEARIDELSSDEFEHMRSQQHRAEEECRNQKLESRIADIMKSHRLRVQHVHQAAQEKIVQVNGKNDEAQRQIAETALAEQTKAALEIQRAEAELARLESDVKRTIEEAALARSALAAAQEMRDFLTQQGEAQRTDELEKVQQKALAEKILITMERDESIRLVKQKAEAERKAAAEEARRVAEEARKREEEERRRVAEETARKAAEELERQKEAEERTRKAAEELERQNKEEGGHLVANEKITRSAAEEELVMRGDEEAERLVSSEEARQEAYSSTGAMQEEREDAAPEMDRSASDVAAAPKRDRSASEVAEQPLGAEVLQARQDNKPECLPSPQASTQAHINIGNRGEALDASVEKTVGICLSEVKQGANVGPKRARSFDFHRRNRKVRRTTTRIQGNTKTRTGHLNTSSQEDVITIDDSDDDNQQGSSQNFAIMIESDDDDDEVVELLTIKRPEEW
jgi:hypothetical protein